MLDGLRIVLVRTRFPENVGMAARACANMGVRELHLVAPELWDPAKAAPLATPKGLPILESLTIDASIEDAVADTSYVVGTTARRGGWRTALKSPKQIAEEITTRIKGKIPVSILFGSEDRGLENAEITHCHDLVTIPTEGAHSLNLAQAVLILLYECATHMRDAHPAQAQYITHKQLSFLLATFKETLLLLDSLHGDNSDYFFLPWQRLLSRLRLSEKEYNALLGLCRQIRNRIGESACKPSTQ
ncbi:MAG: RNA methyltransferase [Desulfovibrionaceae bacterium]|nr:RNA methyltransferase [Desulfovibrionaceae bacterium]